MIEIRFTSQQARGLADAACKDVNRPQLNSIQLKRDRATSTNGHVLLQYRLDDVVDEDGKSIILNEPENLNLIPELAVHRETMSEAVKYAGKNGQVVIRFDGGEDAEVLAQKAIGKNNLIGFGKAVAPEGEFPDFDQVIPGWPDQYDPEAPVEFKPTPIFALNSKYLVLMGKALSRGKDMLIIYVPPGSIDPVVVAQDQKDWRKAFGIIMPARM